MEMTNPCHPGETLRDDRHASGLTVRAKFQSWYPGLFNIQNRALLQSSP